MATDSKMVSAYCAAIPNFVLFAMLIVVVCAKRDIYYKDNNVLHALAHCHTAINVFLNLLATFVIMELQISMNKLENAVYAKRATIGFQSQEVTNAAVLIT